MTHAPSPPAETALGYIARGWSPIPIPPKSKAPRANGWQKMRLADADLVNHFTVRSNVGVLLGEPSGWLIDIDLDHPLAVEWADQFLPKTGAEFGRPSKLRSHRLYRVTAPVATHKRMLSDKERTMIVELRSTGAQTVFPGSTHPSGEAIEWASYDDPAAIDPEKLQAAVDALADWVVTLVDAATAEPRDGDKRALALSALGGLRPARADSYHEWVAVGMALHSVGADDEMLTAWDKWSRRSDKYKSGECATKWHGLRTTHRFEALHFSSPTRHAFRVRLVEKSPSNSRQCRRNDVPPADFVSKTPHGCKNCRRPTLHDVSVAVTY